MRERVHDVADRELIVPTLSFPTWIFIELSSAAMAKFRSAFAGDVPASLFPLDPGPAAGTLLVLKFPHFLLLLTDFAVSIMFQIEAFSAMYSFTGIAFPFFDQEDSIAVFGFANGEGGIGLEEFKNLKLF